MPEKCLIEIANYKIEVRKSQLWLASSEGSTLRVSVPLLRLDANTSLAGERLAGPLLLPLRLSSCDPSLEAEVRSIAASYRRRVIVEQLYDAYIRMGPLSREALIDPAFPPASRLWLLRRPHACLVLEAGVTHEDLRAEYRSLAKDVAMLSDGMLVVDPPSIRLEFRAVVARARAMATSVGSRVPLPRLPWEGDCGLPEWAADPWGMIRLPEGVYRGPCRDPAESLGVDGRCRPAGGRFASSLVCEGSHGRVVLKDYMKMALKWLPAAVASSVAVRYRLGPRSRLAADYRYLRLLRDTLPTPRFLAVCSDVARAGALREYVDGTPVLDSGEPEHWRLAGEALGAIHESGYAVGDPNPGNFIVASSQRRPLLIDAEQARPFTRRRGAWDLIVASIYSSMFNVGPNLISAFIGGYLDSWADARRVAEAALSPALWVPLQVLPQAARARQLLRRALR